jgi:hypothetical protein
MNSILIHSTARLVGLLCLMMLMAACSSGPKIVANHDPAADFSAFRTFDYVQPLSTDRSGSRSLLSTYMMSATTAQLEARGIQRDAKSPDLLIDFILSMREKIQTRSQPTTSASMHRGRGRAGTWSGYSMGMSTTQVTQTTEGTAAIDVIDRAHNQLVWEAAASGRVTEETRENLESVVQIAIADMFARFPVPEIAPAP